MKPAQRITPARLNRLTIRCFAGCCLRLRYSSHSRRRKKELRARTARPHATEIGPVRVDAASPKPRGVLEKDWDSVLALRAALSADRVDRDCHEAKAAAD